MLVVLATCVVFASSFPEVPTSASLPEVLNPKAPSSASLPISSGVQNADNADDKPAQAPASKAAMAENQAKVKSSEASNAGVSSGDKTADPKNTFREIWGIAPWPKKGQDRYPIKDIKGAEIMGAGNGFTVILSGSVAFLSIGAFGGAAYYAKRRGDGSMALEAEQELLLGARRASEPSSLLFMHFRALSTATCWRHMHARAMWMHMLRVAIPGGFLYMLHKLRGVLAVRLSDPSTEGGLALTSMTKEDISDAILDYAFTVVALVMVAMSMVFFVRQLSADSESGLRHLLHISGVSRTAYLLSTIGVDGFATTMFGLFFLLAFADSLLQLRLVMWTSPFLLVLMMSLLAMSTMATGYLLHLLSPSARVAAMAANFTLAILIFNVPFSAALPVVPEYGQQGWLTYIFPSITAYRSLFELVAGCVKGRCISVSDLTDALLSDRKAFLGEMIIGSSDARNINDVLTPASSLLSFLLFAVFLNAIALALVIVLDQHFYPCLSKSIVDTTDTAVLKVENVAHQYGIKMVNTVQVLNGVNFSIQPQEVLGLLGPNGAGKTTTIRCIVGEEQPSSGTVELNSRTAAGGAYIGFCPQETVVISDLTVAENLLFFAYVRGATGVEACHFLESILTSSRLTDKRDWMPDTLSGGMRRRLAVSCALIGAPSVAILDEPTTGLDPMSRRGIWSTILENKLAGTCCLLTTHMLEEAEALCSNLVILTKGSIAATGSVQELKEQWGTGYFLNVDSKAGEEEKCQEFVSACLPDCISEEDRRPIKSNTAGQMTFKLNVEEESLGRLIITMAQGKKEGGVLRWGLSQASLEDTYLQIIDGLPKDAEMDAAHAPLENSLGQV